MNSGWTWGTFTDVEAQRCHPQDRVHVLTRTSLSLTHACGQISICGTRVGPLRGSFDLFENFALTDVGELSVESRLGRILPGRLDFRDILYLPHRLPSFLTNLQQPGGYAQRDYWE